MASDMYSVELSVQCDNGNNNKNPMVVRHEQRLPGHRPSENWNSRPFGGDSTYYYAYDDMAFDNIYIYTCIYIFTYISETKTFWVEIKTKWQGMEGAMHGAEEETGNYQCHERNCAGRAVRRVSHRHLPTHMTRARQPAITWNPAETTNK